MIEHVRQKIKEAFERARQQPVDKHMPAQPQKPMAVELSEISTETVRYTSAQARQFNKRASILFDEALASPEIKRQVAHRSAFRHSWWVGDLNKQQSAEEILAEVETLDAPKKEKKS